MIQVSAEPPEMKRFTPETCCFCKQPTRFWYTPKDVACCPICAQIHSPEEVPSKEEWMQSQRALMTEEQRTRFDAR